MQASARQKYRQTKHPIDFACIGTLALDTGLAGAAWTQASSRLQWQTFPHSESVIPRTVTLGNPKLITPTVTLEMATSTSTATTPQYTPRPPTPLPPIHSHHLPKKIKTMPPSPSAPSLSASPSPPPSSRPSTSPSPSLPTTAPSPHQHHYGGSPSSSSSSLSSTFLNSTRPPFQTRPLPPYPHFYYQVMGRHTTSHMAWRLWNASYITTISRDTQKP